MEIPLVDLSLQTREIAAEVMQSVAAAVADSAFILGPAVAEFEAAYARACGLEHCVGVANGTDAIELMLRAAGIGAGDEVLLPANTFVATAVAVVRAGARPVLADVDPHALLLDPAAVRRAWTGRTRAILAVHLYGQLAAVEELAPIAEEHGALLLEDAAQCHGARRHGSSAGALGLAAATSFYPGKNLGAFGDAGAVLTRDDELAARLRRLRNFGSEAKYDHPEIGFNSRLDTVQAVVLLAKLQRLAAWTEARRAAARRFDELLAEVADVGRPVTLPGNEHAWHLYVVRVPERDRIFRAMQAAGIGVGIHYPRPIHLQGAFAHLGYGSGSFPQAERAADEILSLPIYPGITPAQQERIVEVLATEVRATKSRP